MKAKNQPRFDIDLLRELAGEKVFARGEAYHRDGQVQILGVKAGRVLAQVAGSEDYRTELTGQGENIDGTCSCPAFDDWGFCKHMVATALAANELCDGEIDGSGPLGRIRGYLKEKGIDGLVEIIMDLVERDPALFRKLDAVAALPHEDDKTLTVRLRKLIDGATRTRGYLGYGDVPGWAAQVESALDTVAGLASGARAGISLELAERAIGRIEEAVEEIDDSDGHCGALLERARDIHLAASRETRPEPIQLARDLFAREMEDDFGTFDGAAGLYADVLGEAGLAEYRRLATKAWEKVPSSPGRNAQEDDLAGNSDQLMRILDFFAERAGDVDTRIALRARDLSSEWRYLQLAEFCLSQGREAEALRRAEEGLWMFEDGRPDERLAMFAAELLTKAGRKGDAEAHLQRAFENAPSLELYNRIRALGGEAARDRILKFLEAKQVRRERIRWHDPSDLLIRIWMEESSYDAAWAAVRKHGASLALKEKLANESEATHPREALEVYAERVDQLANAGGTAGYTEAAKLVTSMAKLRGKGEHVAYVLGLQARFGRRRNFMKLLD